MIRLMRAARTQTCLRQLLQEPEGKKEKNQMHVSGAGKKAEEEEDEDARKGRKKGGDFTLICACF